ncbi:hypothetical protein E0W68_12365 [Flavobacterium salilacus subsp. salilacus]|uniref:DUF6268 family outer membrane beta-barrel protein n=1 Tax=Flavobacterium TaxID=237 RepID=UPI001074F0B0|nr:MULTISPECIES: DUF6268 family outer membrane beta-barrel protein [Flavobacterium]KAF2516320.1 hypothetical protein E0W68_12365 [Flavobacterium salilacus subsp. salilacus]MBE1613851.1 hypothetical protein [Flavobacterium sp. SaA2.13]
MSRLFAVLILLVFAMQGYSQETASAIKYNYSAFYDASSTTLVNHNAVANFKQNFSKSSIAYTGTFNAYGFEYAMADVPFTVAGLENINSLELGITYTQKTGNNWSIIAAVTPEVVADFESGIALKDIYPGFFAGAGYTTSDKKSHLTFGAGYKGYFGKYRLLPIVNFSRKVNEKLFYTIGIPATSLSYTINQKHRIKSEITADGFYSRIRGDNYFYNIGQSTELKIDALQMVMVTGGVEYNYTSDDNWIASFKVGHNLYNSLDAIDGQDKKHEIGFNNDIKISVGFIYNINFN